jgi:poly-gamma-glutamate synthesis protein (capsule biosynthesis protein)
MNPELPEGSDKPEAVAGAPRAEGADVRPVGLLLGLAGDLLIDRDNPHEVFTDVRDLLRAPDILFANLESPYSDAPGVAITANLTVVPRMHNLDAYAPAGFHVMSLANNHIVDAGHAAMLETRAHLRKQGIATCGAGEQLATARRPAIIERNGVRVGFLAYASVFPHGYEARSNIPGLAPLRAYNHFHEFPAMHAPGAFPRVETLPDPKDHRNLEEDIEVLRKEVDVVAASFHWGDFLRPFVLTDHERRTARFCIDRGTDLVIGHHHHALRGIEWYRGRPVFYGLGHLVFDLRLVVPEELERYVAETDPESYGICPREGWPLLPLHPDTRMTLLGWVRVEGRFIVEAGFVPCRLNPDGRVRAVDPESTEGRDVVEYVRKCNGSQKLNGRIVECPFLIGGCKALRVVPADV